MNYHGVEAASWQLLTATRRRHRTFDHFLARLTHVGDPVLFGGAVRDACLYRSSARPRDFDFVVAGVNAVDLHSAVAQGPWNFRRNRFGGYKVQVEGIKVDVWSLDSTWAFREGHVETVALTTLPRTVFLNIDSVAFSIKDRKVIEYGFCQAINRHELDIVLEDNPFPTLNILRALQLRTQLGYRFSCKLKAYIQNWLHQNDDPLPVLREWEQRRYGHMTVTEQDIRLAIGV